jgi:predicted ester cyclase
VALAKIWSMDVSRTEIVRDLMHRLFNGHSPQLASLYCSPDLVWHGGSVGTVQGIHNYEDVMREFFDALPDVHAVEQDVVESTNTVAMRFVVEGTHQGDLWGIPGTGHQIQWDAVMIYRFVGPMIVEQWAAEDWTAILQGVGAYHPQWAS